MMKFKAIIFLLVVICSSAAYAATNRFNLLYTPPVSDGGTFFTVHESATLKQFQWSLGTYVDFAYKPLKAQLGGVNVDIVKRYVDEHFYGAIGLTDWLEFMADIPIAWNNRFINPSTLSPAEDVASLGDLFLDLKLRLVNREGFPFGIAFIPFVSLPTGKNAQFMGDDTVTGGGKFVLDGTIWNRLTLSANVGGLARKNFSAYGLNFHHQFLLSGGAAIKLTDWVSLVGEMETRTPFGDFFKNKSNTPTEGKAGLQWRFGEGRNIIINTGGGFGIEKGTGAPTYRLFAGFTYRAPAERILKRVITDNMNTKDIENAVQQTVYFAPDSAAITDDAAVILGHVSDTLYVNPWVAKVDLYGYTDDKGPKIVNYLLGKLRAEAVKKYLIYHGIDAGRIETATYGEKNSRNTNATANDKAKNRRVEIVIKESSPR